MFKEKTVWITGASSGIGEALAHALAQKGAKLILSARRENELERVKSDIVATGMLPEDAVRVLPFDVTDEENHGRIVEQARAFTGTIDWLVNNAGISQRSLCVDTKMDTYRKLFEVDVFAQISLTKHVLPVMLDQGFGNIAATSSVAGKVGVQYRTGYCAAKHAIMGFFDALRAELARSNIGVTVITPGFIRTRVSENALTGDGVRFGSMDKSIAGGMDVNECAKVIVRGFEKGKQEIAVGNGKEMNALWLKRLFPNLLFKIMAKAKSPD